MIIPDVYIQCLNNQKTKEFNQSLQKKIKENKYKCKICLLKTSSIETIFDLFINTSLKHLN